MTPEQIVEFVEGLARVAAAGGGAQALAAHLADHAKAGVLVESAAWHHIAAAGRVRMPASARGAGEANDATSHRTVAIAAGGMQLGYLSAFTTEARNPSDLVSALRLTAAAIAIELARERPGRNGRTGSFWEALLDRAYHDPTAVRDEATAREIALSSQYVVVIVEPEIGEGADLAAELAALRGIADEVFRVSDEAPGLLERTASLVIFAPVAREIDVENVRTAASLLPKTLAKRHHGTRVSGGVGTPEPVLAAYRSFDRASAALAIARRIYGPSHVAVYDELGAYPLLFSDTNVETMRSFARATLAPLRAYDEKHQTELERTLRVYFAIGENVKTASTELNVHRHTVFYRLRQIAEILQRRLESPHDQLTLRLALAIDALHAQ